jgi:hypothetical protein
MRTLFCWRKGRAHLIWLAGLQGHGKLVASIFVSRSTSRATRRRRCCCSCIYLFFLSLSASTNHSAAFKRDGEMIFLSSIASPLPVRWCCSIYWLSRLVGEKVFCTMCIILTPHFKPLLLCHGNLLGHLQPRCNSTPLD